jgi:predicted glycogen debranching enzyme
MMRFDSHAEWLEADGLGGFASGMASGIRTRRYHALLLAAMRPPTERVVLVNGFDASVETTAGAFALSSQAYTPDVIHPDGARRIVAFEWDPWPRWLFELEDGTRIEQEIFVPHGRPLVVLIWKLFNGRGAAEAIRGKISLSVRLFLSGRDYHALHHENSLFNFEPVVQGQSVTWRPYPGLPGIVAISNGDYAHQPAWYRNFLYAEERARGLDDTEDLAAPGIFRWNLGAGEANLTLSLEGYESTAVNALKAEEYRRRRSFPSRLHYAADAYIVRRGKGKTIIAGYPWFTDWGRDTFIALRGLCLATGRLDDAREILLQWAGEVSQGMLPNRFPDRGETPEFNSVDASLWYVVAVHDFLQAMEAAKRKVSPDDERRLRGAIEAILSGYAGGTRYGIRLDGDGLLAAGQAGMQLTWMDAKIGDWVITPRVGKPVEVQALWLNAVKIASRDSTQWQAIFERGLDAFRTRFWNPSGYLYDVVDVDHRPGALDPSFRPNQIFAIGGLPLSLLDGAGARQVVEAVEARLWTPVGLRSLAPGEPGYAPRCEGGVAGRDCAYHQGTVWPWLLGPFVEAWVRVRGGGTQAKKEARVRFLEPLLGHLDEAGLGHISEIADGDPPYTPRGCPFQAWSLGEELRLSLVVFRD